MPPRYLAALLLLAPPLPARAGSDGVTAPETQPRPAAPPGGISDLPNDGLADLPNDGVAATEVPAVAAPLTTTADLPAHLTPERLDDVAAWEAAARVLLDGPDACVEVQGTVALTFALFTAPGWLSPGTRRDLVARGAFTGRLDHGTWTALHTTWEPSTGPDRIAVDRFHPIVGRLAAGVGTSNHPDDTAADAAAATEPPASPTDPSAVATSGAASADPAPPAPPPAAASTPTPPAGAVNPAPAAATAPQRAAAPSSRSPGDADPEPADPSPGGAAATSGATSPDPPAPAGTSPAETDARPNEDASPVSEGGRQRPSDRLDDAGMVVTLAGGVNFALPADTGEAPGMLDQLLQEINPETTTSYTRWDPTRRAVELVQSLPLDSSPDPMVLTTLFPEAGAPTTIDATFPAKLRVGDGLVRLLLRDAQLHLRGKPTALGTMPGEEGVSVVMGLFGFTVGFEQRVSYLRARACR